VTSEIFHELGKQENVSAQSVAAVESVATLSAEDIGWMMRSIRDAQSRIAEEAETHAKYHYRLSAELALIAENFERATKEDKDKIAYLEAQLTAHLLNKRAADESVKSIRTPWGVVESREQQPEYIKDDAVLQAWADAYVDESGGTFLRTKATRVPDWEAIKMSCKVRDGKLITFDGEIVPGVSVIDRGPKVTVKVAD
jgi:hypothetical protein